MKLLRSVIILMNLLFIAQITMAQNPFITTWNVESNDTIVIPLQPGTYNFNFQWTLITNTTVQISGNHTNADGDFTTAFVNAGIYELEIEGDFPHLRGYPADKLLDVLQWGDIVWRNMESMFTSWPGAEFSAVDVPDLSLVTNMKEMFNGASNFNGDLSTWDVSNIRNMDGVFRDAPVFNQPIGSWDVGQVTNMNALFIFAISFNQDISSWNVSSVTNMNSVFFGASSFNQPIGTWDVSEVTKMVNTFRDATSFNQDISSWDVSQVVLMEQMFQDAVSFNQPLDSWDVRNVGNFRRMLSRARQFDQPLGSWKFKSNADFREFSVGSNNLSCENYSSTILGWNFNNPDLENLSLGGFNAEYDSIASRARDELIARGWSMSAGTDIGGDCMAMAEIRCQDTVIVSNDTLFANLLIPANELITLENVVIEQPGAVTISAPEVELNAEFEVLQGVELEILQAMGCP